MTTKDMVAEVSEESEPTETRADVCLERDDDAAEGELDLLELVRERLGLDDDISDMTIASSLAAIAAQSEQPDRWLAAVASPLGKRLASRGADLDAALGSLVALAQTPFN